MVAPGLIGGVRGPEVVLSGGDDASGLAEMLAGLLAQNVHDFPARARVAAHTRGDVVLRASDRDLAVTLRFTGDRVVVSDGAAPNASALAGPWLEMAKLCSAQVSPLSALRSGALRMTPGRRPLALVGAAFALSVPSAFYDDEEQARARQVRRARRATIAVAVVVAAAGATLLARRLAHPQPS